jgi:eukaryotic-like serine/threonine-protein kinase
MGPAEGLAWLAHLETCADCRLAFGRTVVGLSAVDDRGSWVDSTLGSCSDSIPGTIAGDPRPASAQPTILSGLSGEGPPVGVVSEVTLRDPAGSLGETMMTLVPAVHDPYLTICPDPETEDGGETGWSLGAALFPTEPPSGGGPRDGAWPTVPSYELISKLGQGGMGVVYKARQRQLNRLVALKMIRDNGQVGPHQFARFRLEAEAVARLHHPNIVQIYEIGEADGFPFLSLELLEGGGLDTKLGGKPQPRRESAEMVATLASAIQAAHQARVIHRDLKPANVVMTAAGVPKITDFGLAKRLEEESSQTRTGEVVGSPSYMAPEQAKGQIHLLGPATDIYALGAILYEMLTGRPPFQGASAWETVRLVIEQDPVPPSRLQPRMTRDLETICLKCLEKEPSRRYTTAQELADDLRRHLAGEPIRARRTPPWERALKWARRRPATATLAGVAASGLIGLAAAGLWFDRRARIEREHAAERFAVLFIEGRDELARGEKEAAANPEAAAVRLSKLRENLEKLPPATRAEPQVDRLAKQAGVLLTRARADKHERDQRERFDRKDSDFQRLRDEILFLDTDFEGIGLPGQGGAAQAERARKADEALALFTDEQPDGGRTLGSLPASLSAERRDAILEGCCEALLIRAEAEVGRAREPGGRASAARALAILDSAPRLSPTVTRTRAYRLRRADCLAGLGDQPGAARERAEAAGLAPAGAFDHFLYGRDLYKEGRLAEAMPEFRSTLKTDPDHFWARCLLAIADLRFGRPAEARILLDGCLQDRRGVAWMLILRGYANGQVGALALGPVAALGPAEPPTSPDEDVDDVPDPVRDGPPRGASDADFEAAEDDFRAALAALDPADLDLRYALLVDRGLVRFWGGRRLVEAADDFEEALRVRPGKVNAQVNLAGVYLRQGKDAQAVDRLTRAIEQGPARAELAAALRFRAYLHARNACLSRRRRERVEALARLGRPTGPGAVAGELGEALLVGALREREETEGRLALADFEAIPRGPGERPEEVAADHAHRAELLFRARRFPEALDAADAALAAAPEGALAHRWRAGALLELGRYDEAIRSCDVYLARGRPSADLFSIRGRARAARRDLAAAIEDYSRALGLRPDRSSDLVQRGWAYLFSGAPKLAGRDFEAALRLDPAGGEAYAGRGSVRINLGLPRDAASDADEALRRGDRSHLKLYRCARIYAQAADAEFARDARQYRALSGLSREYAGRAVALLREALEARDPSERAGFFRQAILGDEAFRTLVRLPRFDFLRRAYTASSPEASNSTRASGPTGDSR